MINVDITDHLKDIPNEKLLEKFTSAFEIAIKEIRKIENGEYQEWPCKFLNPDGLETCKGSTDKAFSNVCRYCYSFTGNIKPLILQKKVINPLKLELKEYAKKAYELGYNNGKEKLNCLEDEIDQINEMALCHIFEEWQKTQNIILYGSDGE